MPAAFKQSDPDVISFFVCLVSRPTPTRCALLRFFVSLPASPTPQRSASWESRALAWAEVRGGKTGRTGRYEEISRRFLPFWGWEEENYGQLPAMGCGLCAFLLLLPGYFVWGGLPILIQAHLWHCRASTPKSLRQLRQSIFVEISGTAKLFLCDEAELVFHELPVFCGSVLLTAVHSLYNLRLAKLRCARLGAFNLLICFTFIKVIHGVEFPHLFCSLSQTIDQRPER